MAGLFLDPQLATPRKIVHVDMDAFYASVHQRDEVALRGKPVIVAWKGKRSVVCAASYEARRFGIHSAMPAVTAERLCPDAIFVPPDFSRYKEVSCAVRDIFQRHRRNRNRSRLMKHTWMSQRTRPVYPRQRKSQSL